MANVPGALPDGLDPADFGPAVPLSGSIPARSSMPRPAAGAVDSRLPEGLNPADFGPPVETYQPVGMDVDGLRSSLNRSLGVQPDHAADIFKISRRTGLDVGTVERNLPEAKRADELARSAEGLGAFMQRNPKATAWLRDPANFGLAKDDLDALGGVEQAFMRHSAAPADQEDVGGVGTSLLKTVKRTIPTVGSSLYDMYGLGAGSLDYIERGLGNLLGTGSTGVFGKGRDWLHGQSSLIAENILAQPGLSLPQSKQGRLWDNPRLLLDPEWLTFNVGDAANSMLPTIASLFISGGATAVPAVIGAAQEAGNLYRQLISDDKADPDKALSASLAYGVVVSQLEKLGLDKIMDKRVASTVAKRVAKATVAGATEGGTEYLEEPFQAFFQGIANNESPEQVTARVADALKNIDVIPGAFLLGGAGAYGNTAHEYHKAKAAQRMGKAFDEIGEFSSESKLNARLPEAYQDYVEHVRRETGGAVPEKVYVSAQRLAEAVVDTGASGGDGSVQADAQVLAQFFQSIGVEPVQAQRMAALDQDVAIPFALYQSKIAATDMGQALANDIRFTHDGMTRTEAVQFEKEFQGRVQDELAVQEQNRAQHDADLGQAIVEYKDELARVGMKGKDADTQLQLLTAGANVAAAKWSAIKGEPVTPAQWLREVRGLQIRAVEQSQARNAEALSQAAMRRTQATSIVDFARLVRESGAVEFFDGIQAGGKLKEATGKSGLLVNVPYDFVQHLDNSRGPNADRVLSFVGDVIASADEIIPAGGPKRPGRGERFFAVKYSEGVGHVVVGEVLSGKRGDRFLPITAFDGPEARIREALKARREGHSTEATGGYVAEVRAILSQLDADITTPDSEGNTFPQGSRGTIAFTDQGTFISLFKKAANLSTLPHELGHLFVNDLEAMVTTGNAPESVVKDLEKLRSYAGGDLSTKESQETLARAFEAYLREGKAPSAELRPAFQRFAAWLTAIYRDIRALVGPDGLSDEVRGVFDRMLASEDEIAGAEAYYGARDALENVAADMLTDAEKKRIAELRGASHAAAFEKRVKRYVSAYLKALGGKKVFEAEARAEVEAKPVYAAADEAVAAGGLSYGDVALELGGTALIPELNKRRPGLVRDNGAVNIQLRKKHDDAVAALRKSGKKDAQEQRSFLSEMFDEGLKNNTAWRIKSFLLYGTDPMGEHAGATRADKTAKGYKPGTVGLDHDDALYHFGKQGIEGVQVGLVKRGGYKIDRLMQEWGLSSADEVLDALHFKAAGEKEAFVSSGMAELNQNIPEFQQDRAIGVTLPEALALRHGFDSAEHMLMEILKSQNKGEAVKALLDKKIAAKEAELRESLANETVPGDEDVHSDEVLERLTTEARALERQIYATAGAKVKVGKPINAAASHEVARAVLDTMTVADARDYSRFASAERRAGVEAIRAAKAQNWQEALAAKQREAINHALVIEAVKLREEVVKEIGFARRIGNSKSMRFEAKEQALSVIQAYGLGTEKMVPERPGELVDLAGYLRSAFEGDLFNPFDAFPGWLLNKEKAGSYRALSVADFREVTYLMRNLADVGGSAAIHMATEDVSYGAKAAELSEVIHKSGNKAAQFDEGTEKQKWSHRFRSVMSTMNQQLDMFRKADGYINLGPEKSHLVGKNQEMYERIQAGTMRMLGMQQALEPAMQDVAKVRLAFAERFRKTYGERVAEINGVAVPQIMQDNQRFSWTAEHVWAIARNIGNGGNRRCLIEGLGLSWGEIQRMLTVLTKAELLAVQREGKIIGSHYAEADKTFRQVYHRPMAQRIEYQPMTIQAADGPVQLDGWYFPIKPDAKLNQRAGDREGADIMKADASASAFPPNPRKSFTNARTGAAVPVALSFDVFERGLAEQTRFIALAPILKDADRVFRQEEYRRAYTDAFGREAYDEIRPWLKNIATPGMEQADAYDDILSKARRGATAYILIGNLKSALKQELGHLPAMKEMGTIWALRGMKALAVDGEMTVEAINAMDPRMKNREKGFDTEQRELLAKARNETVKLAFGKIDTRVTEHDVLKFGMTLQRVFDRHTTYSVWAGAFFKGRDGLHMSEQESIDYAYRMVERSQVTNTDAAMNTIQRGKSWVRLFSMFMSEAFPKGSRMRVDFNAFKAGKIGAEEYARTIGYELIAPVLFNVVALNLLTSVAPDRPKEYFWALWNELLGVFPLLGGVSGWYMYGSGPAESPAFTGMEVQLKAAKKAFDLAQDFEDENRQAAMFKALIDVAAYKYKVGNVRRFYETAAAGFEDMADGEMKNPFRLVIRKPKGHE